MNKPYIRRSSLIDVQAPPWRSDGGEGYSFSIPADLTALQQLCDRLLNHALPAGLRYRPAGDTLLLTVQRIERFHSIGVPVSEQVRYTYNEASIWVSLEREDGTDAFLLPYVFHDSNVPTAIGRELYGFAKELANVSMPVDASAFKVEALCCVQPGAVAQLGEVMSLTRLTQEISTLAFSAQEFVGLDLLNPADQSRVLSRLGPAALPYSRLTPLNFDTVFLRQFGSPTGQGCDVQDVVHTRIEIAQGASMPTAAGKYRLTLPPLHSHPIAQDLGIALDAQHSTVIDLNFKSAFSFTLHAAS